MAESSTITREMIKAAATVIANNRAARGHGAPPISNVLDILPEKLLAEVMEDAEAALTAAFADAWAPLQSAPQDGEVFLVASVAGTGPTLCSFADGYFRLVSNREKLAGYGIWFWQRLPTPPSAALATGGARG